MNLVKSFRLASGVAPSELAKVANIGEQAYRDLEEHDDEIGYAISVENVVRLARRLGTAPSALFGGVSTGRVSREELAKLIQGAIARRGESVEDFEQRSGWGVSEALTNPERFNEFNADGIRDVCEEIGVNWFNVLDAIP